MSYEILKATTPDERKAIFRFRYKVYIEEMEKWHVKADHENKLLYDEADDYTILYYSVINNGIAATVRSQRGTEGPFTKEGKKFFGIDDFEAHFDYRSIAIVDRLIIDKPYRNGLLTHRMMLETYIEGLQVGTRLCFISCDDQLLSMYLRYGFRTYAEPVILPTGARRHKLLLFLCDKAHLQKVKSPFLPYLPDNMDDNGAYAALAEENLGLLLSDLRFAGGVERY